MRDILRLASVTAAGRQDPHRSSAGPGIALLHRRDHGDQRARSPRKPRRRWSIRQPGRHVSRERDSGVRLLARPRADSRRHAGARNVPARCRYIRSRCRRCGDLEETAQLPAMETAIELRKTGTLRVDLYPDVAKKMERVFKYVDQRRARFIAIVGGDESRRGHRHSAQRRDENERDDAERPGSAVHPSGTERLAQLSACLKTGQPMTDD